MPTIRKIFYDLVIKTLEESYKFLAQFLPKVALSLIILLIGWISAVLVKKIVSKILKALGFDVVSERIGLKNFLERGDIRRSASSIIGVSFYWLIILSTLVMAFNTLDLEVASELIKQAIFYIPKIIVALVLLALGIFLGKFVGKLVETASHSANIPFHTVLGKVASYLIIGLAIMIALEHLGAATTIVVESYIIIFGIVLLVFCLIVLIGGRDIVSSALAGRLLKEVYKEGDKIEFDSISGQIESIDFITTKIKNDVQEIIIPNSELANKVVKKSRT